MPAREHIRDVVLAALGDRPARVALDIEGSAVTRGELLRKSWTVAAGLRAHGIMPGVNVGLVLLEPLPIAECMYGGWINGNTVVLCNSLLPCSALGRFIHDSQARALIVSAPLLDRVETALEGFDQVPLIFVVGHSGDHRGYARLLENAAASASLARAPDGALMLDSFGSRYGSREAVIATSENLLAQLAIAREVLAAAEGDRVWCSVPLFHAVGLSVLNACIAGGATLVLRRRSDQDLQLDRLERDEVSVIAAPPWVYSRLLDGSARRLFQLPELRRCITVGAQPSGELRAAWSAATAVALHAAHVQVEACGFVCVPHAGNKPGSVGRLHPHVRVRIVDPEGSWRDALPAGEIGEIHVSGPAVVAGHGYPPSDIDFHQGWFLTGRAGYLDDDGDLFLVDELAIRRDGRLIPCDTVPRYELEDALHMMPEVLEAAVCVVPDPLRGGRIRAALVLRPGAKLDAEAIQHALQPHLDEDHLPSDYVFMAELPRTAAGQIARRELRALLGGHVLGRDP